MPPGGAVFGRSGRIVGKELNFKQIRRVGVDAGDERKARDKRLSRLFQELQIVQNLTVILSGQLPVTFGVGVFQVLKHQIHVPQNLRIDFRQSEPAGFDRLVNSGQFATPFKKGLRLSRRPADGEAQGIFCKLLRKFSIDIARKP